MYSADEVEHALALLRCGSNFSQVSRETGISRSALRAWASGNASAKGFARRRGSCMRCAGYRFPVPGTSEFAYAYMLGMYLGDGCVSSLRREVFSLRVFLDRAYPVIVLECAGAMSILAPDNRISVVHSLHSHMDIVKALSRHWPCLFPQHGPGRKHQRPIVLEAWQREILDRYPWRFLRGLIQSDGCRSLNTIKHPKKTYVYPRYEFTNRSDDIRNLFCEFCDKVGVEWRRMNRWSISVARRDSVALMDRHIGPKR